jgi:hypothetical protein
MARITTVWLRGFLRRLHPARSLFEGVVVPGARQGAHGSGQVAATALNCDGREWAEVAGRRFSTTECVLPA